MEMWIDAENAYNKKNQDYSESSVLYNILDCDEDNKLNFPNIKKGENKVTVITFIMNRYINSMDISNKKITVFFRINDVSYVVPVINVKVSKVNSKLKFTWLIDKSVTIATGKLKFCIKISTVETEDLIWFSDTYTVNVCESLDSRISDLSTESQLWLSDVATNISDTVYKALNDVNFEITINDEGELIISSSLI